MEHLLNRHLPFIEYLSDILGPNYEISLYSVTDGKVYLLESRNRFISFDAEKIILDSIEDADILFKKYKRFLLPYDKNFIIKSSILFIRAEDTALSGFICTSTIVRLNQREANGKKSFHKSEYTLKKPIKIKTIDSVYNKNEPLGNLSAQIKAQIEQIMNDMQTNLDIISTKERVSLIKRLYESDIFEIKGSVALIAEELKVSEASVYRYLRTIHKKNAVKENLTYLM